MKKMRSLFRKTYDKGKVTVHNEITPGKEWALEQDSIATEKIDGSACMVSNGQLYARYDFKKGKKNLPEGSIPCQPEADWFTGHFPHWIPIDVENSSSQSQYKWQIEAWKNSGELEDGTYEAVGPHFQSNPHGHKKDILIKHGSIIIDKSKFGEKLDFDSIKKFLEENEVEGIVFHKKADTKDPDDMCKITRRDFGIEWNKKINKR